MKFKFLLFVFAIHVSTDVFAFDIPEKLHYDLTWAGIKTGESTLEARDNGTDIQFISKANSAKWVSIFYKVEDTVVSTLKKKRSQNFVGIPQNYRIKLREGKYRRDSEGFLWKWANLFLLKCSIARNYIRLRYRS